MTYAHASQCLLTVFRCGTDHDFEFDRLHFVFQDSIYELADENTATHNEVQKVIGKAAAERAEEKPKEKVGQLRAHPLHSGSKVIVCHRSNSKF